MFKVLIADDEQPVLDGLQFLIKKHFTRLIVAGVARNGREAIEQAKLTNPDIILMDVKMPGITGLEAVREIRQHLPRAVFILVTAYERFEIAKEAFDLGVQDYLLKPVSKDKLLAVLQRCVDQLEALRTSATREALVRENLEEATPLLEQALVGLLSTPHPVAEDLTLALKTLHLRSRQFQAVFLQFRQDHPTKDPAVFYLEMRSQLKYKLSVLCGPLLDQSALLILPCDAANPEPWQLVVQAVKDSGLAWRAGIGQPADWNQHWPGIVSAQLAGLAAAWGEANATAPSPPSPGSFPFAAEKALREALISGEVDQALTLARSFCQPERVAFRQEVLTVLGHCAAMTGQPIEYPFPQLSDQTDPDAVFLEFLRRLALATPSSTNFSPALLRAIAYLEAHFQQPLSLDQVAEAVHLHPQYLSRLFSEEKKESFIDFLTRLRMDKARAMLLAGTSVKDTGLQLGYSDPNYFSRLFKKCQGMTPMEFVAHQRS